MTDFIYQLFIVKRTQVEMISDRGYLIPPEEFDLFLADHSADPSDELLNDFRETYIADEEDLAIGIDREKLSQTYYTEDESQSILVTFTPQSSNSKHSVSVVKAFVNRIITQKVTAAVIISDSGFTPDASKNLASLKSPRITVFDDEELLLNPTSHYLCPKHIKLTQEERREFLIGNKIKDPSKTLPQMSFKDPIVKYYGWNGGDIIRIERENMSQSKAIAQKVIMYRIVWWYDIGVKIKADVKSEKKKKKE